MAFKTEADRLAYEAKMQAFYKSTQQPYNKKPSFLTNKPLRTEADRLMAYRDSEVSSGGGLAMILLGVPLLLIPPVGLFFIVMGVVSMVHAVSRLNDANPQ